MEKYKTLAQAVYNEIEGDYLLRFLYQKLLVDYGSETLVGKHLLRSAIDLDQLLSFADLLSKSTDENRSEIHKCWAQEIIILLKSLYPENEDVGYYLGSILSSISNYRGLAIEAKDYLSYDFFDRLFDEFKKNKLRIRTEQGKYFFEPQKRIIEGFECESFSFSAHNHIYVNDGMQKQPAFFELLKVIFCKIEDEKNIPNPLEFYTTSEERSNPDGQLTVQKRISKIFDRVKKRHGKIFDAGDEIKLSPRSLAYIVSELQRYSLINTNIDIKGKAYEEIVGSNLRGDRGEFFTPRNIMKMTVEMINPKLYERVADTSCGTGGFIVTAMTHVIKQIEESFVSELGKEKKDWDSDTFRLFMNKISEIAGNDFFGFDINPDLVKATKMNMVMNNDGSGNILQTNSLLPPHEWNDDFKSRLAEVIGVPKSTIRNHKSIEFFDVIVTNPPFGSKIPIKDRVILEQFDLAHIWVKNKNTGSWSMTDRIQSSVPPEILFIERCTQFLVPGGRLGIVLPDSILGSPGLGYIREWIIRNHRIVASIDLHQDTFQPRNGTQTSVLILQKKTHAQIDEEEKSGKMPDYSIFMAMIEKIGHDKRGNPLFKRDKEGHEILITDMSSGDSENGAIQSHEQKVKVEDDQTPFVPAIFADWKKEEGISW